jgi:hypothetical protein
MHNGKLSRLAQNDYEDNPSNLGDFEGDLSELSQQRMVQLWNFRHKRHELKAEDVARLVKEGKVMAFALKVYSHSGDSYSVVDSIVTGYNAPNDQITFSGVGVVRLDWDSWICGTVMVPSEFYKKGKNKKEKREIAYEFAKTLVRDYDDWQNGEVYDLMTFSEQYGWETEETLFGSSEEYKELSRKADKGAKREVSLEVPAHKETKRVEATEEVPAELLAKYFAEQNGIDYTLAQD